MSIQNIITVTLLILTSLILYFLLEYRFQAQSKNLSINPTKNMQLSSPAFKNNSSIPPKYTCDGEDVNPPLKITDIPGGTKSLALVVHDPDAPLAGGFTHWIIFNISPETGMIPENNVPPSSIQGTAGSGKIGYTGPCPPGGTHHYHFKLYALDDTLELDSSAKKEDVEKAIIGHIISQTELIGLYKRM